MFNVKRPSEHERSLEFHGRAPFAKHDYRYRSRSNIRMAGSIWGESPQERIFRIKREQQNKRMRHVPVGLGFGERDSFGPDDDYATVEFLNSTPDLIGRTFR